MADFRNSLEELTAQYEKKKRNDAIKNTMRISAEREEERRLLRDGTKKLPKPTSFEEVVSQVKERRARAGRNQDRRVKDLATEAGTLAIEGKEVSEVQRSALDEQLAKEADTTDKTDTGAANTQKAIAVAKLAKMSGGKASSEDTGNAALQGAASGAAAGTAIGGAGWGTAIGAGIGAVSGVMSARSARKQRQRQAEAHGFERQADIEMRKRQEVQSAFQSMMSNMRAALIR